MPECANCESFVTADYARVNAIDGEVLACPFCPDRIPSAGESKGWMEARGTRQSREKTTYDPSYAADGGDESK